MRLEQLYYIVEVADQKSITKAAKNLYLSQPSLSKAISLLESELETTLFMRHQQGIIPTATGSAIIDKARDILGGIDDIKQIAQSEKVLTETATLTVALPILLCNDILSRTIQSIHELYPTLTILPYQSDTYDVINDLSSGSLDLGIISYGTLEKEALEQQLKNKHIFFRILSRETFYAVVSKDSPVSANKTITAKALNALTSVTFSQVFNWDSWGSTQDTSALNLPSRYFPDRESIKKCLHTDPQAVTIFPRLGALTDEEVLSGALVAIPITDIQHQQYISLLFNADNAIRPYGQLFIKTFTDIYNEALNS